MLIRICVRHLALISALIFAGATLENGAAQEPDLKRIGEALVEGSGLIRTAEEDRRVVAGKLRAEVDFALGTARKLMAENPSLAEQNLKLTLEILDATPLDSEIRSQLRRQVAASIRQARLRKNQLDHEVAAAQERHAASAEQERVNSALSINQQRLQQIVDRFHSLMDEQRYSVADEQVRPEAECIAANTSIATSLANGGSMQRTVHENERILQQREHNFARTLASVELSLIPFPDGQPIIYLPAEQWEDLTLRRQQYTAVDLGKLGTAEARIHNELNKSATLDVVEMPLKDAIAYLSEAHSIPIILNVKKLVESSVSPDTPVTKSLRGITLRSALRLLLKDLELTYVVRDEVLQVTTPDDAESKLQTKVYPVGDLVVPISTGSKLFGLGGMGSGALNGLGGGGFGSGGGGGGFGGGGGAGGGPGFGGGGGPGVF